jgi:hypothetical protein
MKPEIESDNGPKVEERAQLAPKPEDDYMEGDVEEGELTEQLRPSELLIHTLRNDKQLALNEEEDRTQTDEEMEDLQTKLLEKTSLSSEHPSPASHRSVSFCFPDLSLTREEESIAPSETCKFGEMDRPAQNSRSIIEEINA